MRTMSIIVMILVGALSPIVSAGNEDSQAMKAFSAAMSDVSQREKRAAGIQYAYTQTLHDANGSRVVRRFDSSDANADWTLIEQRGDDLTDLQIDWSVPIQFRLSTFEMLEARFCDHTKSHWIYCARAPISVDMEDDQQAKEANRLAEESLETQIWLHKEQQRVTRMTIFNREPMHPSPLARIDRFEISLEFAPAWPKGPLVTVRATRQLKGKYGFFISLDEHLVQTITDIAALNN